ncbi:hypothetical protein C1646_753263 [Rhizophagus diaphanus]|nr:hypothetical protein C1646_753263 [Rhizophagus diaphanus] [Rhizophagus sp. MUCL 43196]
MPIFDVSFNILASSDRIVERRSNHHSTRRYETIPTSYGASFYDCWMPSYYVKPTLVEINIKKCIKYVAHTWDSVTKTTIENCWLKADILPKDDDGEMMIVSMMIMSSALNESGQLASQVKSS